MVPYQTQVSIVDQRQDRDRARVLEVGSGMGLAVVHGIVEDSRGAIAVSSTPGEGSTFDVDYYKNTHMKLVEDRLGPLGLLGSEVDAGVAGVDNPPPG